MALQETNLYEVNWSRLPMPVDDGGAGHLLGLELPPIVLKSTDGTEVCLARLQGRTVVYLYPKTGRPGLPLPPDWDTIPGARGCTPQACAFRDHHRELIAAGADRVFGLSTQDSEYQREAVARLHLPFVLLSDANLELTTALRLPAMLLVTPESAETLTKRQTLIIDHAKIVHVMYPVFPPDENPARVLAWLKANPR